MTTYGIGIITDGKDLPTLTTTLNSIMRHVQAGVPIKKIIVAGETSQIEGLGETDIFQALSMPEAAEQGNLGRMRNALVVCLRDELVDTIILLDDDIELHDDFFRGLGTYEDDHGSYDILSCKILNPDGSRYWDWARWKGPSGQELMAYDYSDYTNVYITGGLCIARAGVFDHVQWDDDKGFNEEEDIDFSEKVKAAGLRIAFNVHSTVTHHGPYTQRDNLVYKTGEKLPPVAKEGEPLRILWYSVPPWNQTGYGIQTYYYIKALQERGHDVRIVPSTQLRGAPNVEWDGIPMLATGHVPSGLDSLMFYINAWEPHLVITLIDVWPLPEDFGLQVRMLGSRWCPITPIDTDPISPFISSRLAFAHTPIAMSQFGFDRMKKAGLARAGYIPHCVDTRAFAPQGSRAFESDKFVVGMVAANIGSFDRKGFQQAIEAFAELGNDQFDFYLHTDPTPSGDAVPLAALAEHLGVMLMFPDLHQLHQGYSDTFMASLYRSFDVLLMSSRGEGFGIPLIEAQAVGTPVIATDFASMTELSRQGVSVAPAGRVWTPINSWMAYPNASLIANQIRHLKNIKTGKPAKWRGMKANAINFAAGYDVKIVAENFLIPVLEAAAQND